MCEVVVFFRICAKFPAALRLDITSRVGADAFIDNIPGIHHTRIFFLAVCDHLLDIALHTFCHGLRIGKFSGFYIIIFVKEPTWCLIMPDQCVTAHLDSVFLTEFECRVTGIKFADRHPVFALFCCLFIQQIIRLHQIGQGRGIEVLFQNLCHSFVLDRHRINIASVDRGSDKKIILINILRRCLLRDNRCRADRTLRNSCFCRFYRFPVSRCLWFICLLT